MTSPASQLGDLLGVLPGNRKEPFVTQLLSFLLRSDSEFRSSFLEKFLRIPDVCAEHYDVVPEDPTEQAEEESPEAEADPGRMDFTFVPQRNGSQLPYIGVECKIGARFGEGQLDKYASDLTGRSHRPKPRLFAITRDEFTLTDLGAKGQKAVLLKATSGMLRLDGNGLCREGNRQGLRTWNCLFDVISPDVSHFTPATRAGLRHIKEVAMAEAFRGFQSLRTGSMTMADLVQARILLSHLTRRVAKGKGAHRAPTFHLKRGTYKPKEQESYHHYHFLHTWRKAGKSYLHLYVVEYPNDSEVYLEIRYWKGRRRARSLHYLSLKIGGHNAKDLLMEKAKQPKIIADAPGNLAKVIREWVEAKGWEPSDCKGTFGDFDCSLDE